MAIVYSDARIGAAQLPIKRVAAFLVWLAIVSALCWNHVVWRDEVRALSLALAGDSFIDMFRHVHGEGHPAVWYIALRTAHLMIGSSVVLKAVSIATAAAAVYVLLFRLKLPFSITLLVVFSGFSLYEYAVVSRNYGISMLVMFLLAAAYSRWKHRGIVLGLLLALLANTNVHSVVLAFGFLAFWFFDLLFDRQSVAKHYVNLALNSAIAACGVLLCVATVYPPFNDAAQASNGSQGILVLVLRAVLLPFVNFDALYPGAALSQLFPQLDHNSFYQNLVVAALSFLLYGSTLGLAKRPAAMIGALLALVGLSLLFTLVYPGQYRHQALWPAFLVTMYAVVAAADGPADPRFACKRLSGISMFGSTLFVLLLILQVVVGGVKIWQAVTSGLPFSQSKSFAELVLQSPDLADAIIAADPDYLVEPLAYYLPNRTYLLREGRFGNVVKFTKGAQLSLNLNDIRQRALALRDTYHVPIVILLERRLDDVQTNDVIKEGYDWTLSLSPEDVATFKDATEMIRSFGPVVGSDETFDAYRLK